MLRKADARVRRAVAETVREYGAQPEMLLSRGQLLVDSGGRVSVCSRRAYEVLERLGGACHSAGLEIGRMEGRRFVLGLEGAWLIAGRARKYVRVNEKAEQLVLYGRDVFRGSVVEMGELREGDECIVLSPRGDAIALGRVGSGDVFVVNLQDRGAYLRKGE
ncbi:MAG: hypothetical protein GXN98_01510 [Euryarchaeota archaeon]|nr:hypothetical protein [Euryarchaeota archaeon]